MINKIICRMLGVLSVVSIVPLAACSKGPTSIILSETMETRTTETFKSTNTVPEILPMTSDVAQNNITASLVPTTSSPLPIVSITKPLTSTPINTLPYSITFVPTAGATTTPTTSAAPPTFNVTVDASGFKPSTVTIPVGAIIIWFSGEQRVPGCCPNCHMENGEIVPGKVASHWVFHDSDSLINGWLDSNGIYAYFFGSPGEFNYHDNLNPTLKGTIIVK